MQREAISVPVAKNSKPVVPRGIASNLGIIKPTVRNRTDFDSELPPLIKPTKGKIGRKILKIARAKAKRMGRRNEKGWK